MTDQHPVKRHHVARKYLLIPMCQPSPFWCQKIRDHQWHTFTFLLWCCFISFEQPIISPPIILIKGGFIVSDKDQLETPICNLETCRDLVNVTIVVVSCHSVLIPLPSLNETFSVCNDMLMLMSINIHTILLPAISPAHLMQPALCCTNRNALLLCSCGI